MALDTGHTHILQQTEEDMISNLSDDVLLFILGKVNLTTAMRASVLSTRWRHLPWSLSELNIDMKDFLHEPCADPTVADHIDRAMASLTVALRNMLSPSCRKTEITRLRISLIICNSYSSEIGYLVNEVVETGMLKVLELTSGVDMPPDNDIDEEMVKHANGVNSFFGNYPSISHCLTRLLLFHATFAESDLHNLIANVCTELRYLYLFRCETGFQSIFKIDAPNSKLNVLEFAHCCFAQVELLCLPKLEVLICGNWLCKSLSLTLGGHLPCLKEVEIYSAMRRYQEQFKLSELLCGITCINSLSLDFLGEKIWLLPEKYHLLSAFSNLKELYIYDIFVGFGLLWTIALLEAAPSLEILEVEVYDHRCDVENQIRQFCAERSNAPWEVSVFAYPKNLALKELRIIGFNASEEHIVFIGAVMDRASNLKSVALEDKFCKDCDAISTTSVKCQFPKNEDDQEAIVNNLRNRFSSTAKIIFGG
ncbi:hypothetical protein BS78_K157300 [Paspalum vaginatum]|uniref:F-box domain-containing protein n=1 Tax=Paspalum vaginatum TaxID=158149 RepID=A0A9W7XC35_9POAL|nr:hypothetical protein BS78_K157300 [Paspalum vaginatum]